MYVHVYIIIIHNKLICGKMRKRKTEKNLQVYIMSVCILATVISRWTSRF